MKPPLRFVTPRYGPDVVGGTESLVRKLATRLARDDRHVEVWTTDATDEASWTPSGHVGGDQDGPVHIRRFAVKEPRNPERFASFSRVFFRMPAALRPEQRWLRLQGPFAPDLVRALAQAEPMPTIFSPYLYYTTLVAIQHCPSLKILMPAAHDEFPLYLRSVRRAAELADGLLFHTPEERSLFHTAHPSTRATPDAVGTIGVDEQPRSTETDTYVYFGGRSTPGKGMETLVEGFREAKSRVPSLRMLVTGAASDDPMLADEPGVEPRGVVTEDEREGIVASAIATIVPGALESLSMVALESWAAGRPCIMNANSPTLAGQAERSGGALTFRHASDLGSAMATLAANSDLAARLGAQGLEYVRNHYRWDDVIHRIDDLIDRTRANSKQR